MLNKTEILRQAQMHIDNGRVSAAISLYQKIVEADSLDLAAISVLSDLYVKAGRIPDATQHFLRIAENYLRSGSAIAATHILNKVLRIDPLNAQAHMNLGELYARDGKIDQAHTCFIEAGAAFWHKGKIAAAIKMNEQALAVIPNSRQAKMALTLLKQESEPVELPTAPKQITGELEAILISIPDGSDQLFTAEAPPAYPEPPELPPDFGEPVLQEESSSVLDEDGIIEQIARAELLVAYGEGDLAVSLLRETLQHKPDHIQIREKLRDIYLRSEMLDRASEECLNIAGIYAAQGETRRAREYVARARLLLDTVEPVVAAPVLPQTKTNNEEAQTPGAEWNSEKSQAAVVM
ncbi:MAG: tetratricopeptide repeat protein [Blastocatellia bacterium]